LSPSEAQCPGEEEKVTHKTTKALALACIGIFFALAVSAAAERHPLTFADFIKIKRLSDIRLSPRGDALAFVVTEMDLAANRGNSDIWLVGTDGRGLRQLTNSPQADYSPRWSPDGRSLAFLSTRGGSPQVWSINPGGGEAMPVTSFAPGVSSFIWSPDGKTMAFAAEVFPDCPDVACTARRVEEQAKDPVKARLYDALLYRHWNEWWDGRRSHVFILRLDDGRALDVTPGDYDTPPIALGGDQDFVFSPDGKEVGFVRNISPEFRKSLGTNNDVFFVPAGGGSITRVTTSKADDNSPLYSPDGRFIAYKAMARPGFEADKYSLMLYDRKEKTIRNLTEALDYSVGEFVWAPGSDRLYFDAEDRGRFSVFGVGIQGGDAAKVLEGLTLNGLTLSPDGRRLYFLRQSMQLPSEVFAYDLKTKVLDQLTQVNAGLLSELDLTPAEEFAFPGAGGETVHGFLLKPPGFDPARKYPLVMLFHGGPQGAWLDQFHYRWNAPMFAAPGYVVAMINFHGSTGYGQAFTDSISGDWGGKPYRDTMLGLDWLLAHSPWLDPERVGAAGASYGGYLIDWVEGQTDRFRCLVSHSGVFDLRSEYGSTDELWFPEWEFRGTPWTNPEQYKEWSPSYFVADFKTPCLVIHGQLDFRVPLSQGLQLFTSLQRMHVPSRLLTFPDEGHFILKPLNARLWWKTVLEWLGSYLD
jgi:dipeptidyl aminopeptidase/acylaminoacyl peptidase